MDHDALLREQLVKLMSSGEAHADYDKSVADMPVELRGKTPKGAEHSAWQLVEHLRITLHDILDFSRNPDYQGLEWPKEYWPKSPAPPDDGAWDKSIVDFHHDLKEMGDLVSDKSTDLYAKISHGDGQTILREALLIADHTAYHLGQLVMVRRLLGAWD